jgi:hypothetical protein
MDRFFSRFAGAVCFLLMHLVSVAQEKVEMADTMRANGKIYVVVAVCMVLLTGLFVYIFSLDKKITRFEKSMK